MTKNRPGLRQMIKTGELLLQYNVSPTPHVLLFFLLQAVIYPGQSSLVGMRQGRAPVPFAPFEFFRFWTKPSVDRKSGSRSRLAELLHVNSP